MTTIAIMRTPGEAALRRPWQSALRRAAAPGATGPGRRDVLLVGAAGLGVLLEVLLRQDLSWPMVLATSASLAALPWRRVRPLPVVVWTFGLGMVRDVAGLDMGHAPTPLYTSVVLILVPYSLFRWGSGRAILAGAPVVVAGFALSVAAGPDGLDDVVGGATVVVLVVLVAEVVRQRSLARVRDLDHARAREREAIARDLHDTVAHHLSAVAVRAQAGQVRAAAAQDAAAGTEAAVDALRLVEEEARRALGEIRSLVGVLRSRTPDQLTGSMERLRDLADPGPPAVRVHLDAGVGVGASATSTAVVRIAQESVANARRHARGATSVAVRLDRRDDTLHLTVHDDGMGSTGTPTVTGFGLTGMNERALALGGTLDAGPDPAGGWTVSAVLPARELR